MNLIETLNYKEMSRKAANIISAQIILKPDSVLGLATGSTPIGIYEQLIEWYQKGDLDFSKITTINLDEYKGLSKENTQSYFYFMKKKLFDFVNIDTKRTYIPDGMEADTKKACDDYNLIIKNAGGIDLQLLGLGKNGHIGFNEPDNTFEQQTHLVNLSQSTIDANSRFFSSMEEVPTMAYTMGIKNIMLAKKIIVVVSGLDKAEIVKKAFFEEVSPWVPASILQMHPDVTIIGDKDAFSLIYNYK